jgi:L-methionine (R)-S-oxide reductase
LTLRESLIETLRKILAQHAERTVKARLIADAIRELGPYRWAGVYEVKRDEDLVVNIAWSGPAPPTYPVFSLQEGLTSRAIATKKVVNVGNVEADSDYLKALGGTQSEIIVPVLDSSGQHVVGTIDVESEKLNAFDQEAERALEACAGLLRPFWA